MTIRKVTVASLIISSQLAEGGRELIDRVAAGAPVRQLLAGEALGHSADACALDPSINPP